MTSSAMLPPSRLCVLALLSLAHSAANLGAHAAPLRTALGMNATPLYDSALLYWNSSIVSYGGAPRDQPAAIPAALAQLYSLPPALASWTSVVDGPASTGTPWPALVAHSMHLVGPNTALILFGLTRIPSNTWSPSLDSFSGFLYTWDLAAMTIAARPTVPAIGTSDMAPQARGRHSSVFDKSTNTVWVWGGYSAFGPLVELWALDVQTAGWKRMPAPPAAPPGSKSAQPGAVGASMSMLGSSLVICFGSSGPSGSESAGCLLFDTRSHAWSFPSMLGQIPQPRRNSPMTAVSPNTAFIFSGRTASPAAPAKDAWTITISESDRSLSFRPVLGVGIPASGDSASASLVPSFRDGHASVATGDTGNTFIFGGRAGDGASPADAALYVYSFSTRSWVYATSPAISAPTRANQDGQPQRAPLDGSTQGAINSNSNSSTPGETMSTTTLILIAALGVAVLCAVGIIIFVQIRNNRSPARKTHDTGRSKGLTRKASNESARSSSSAASARSKRSSTLTADQVMTASMHSAHSQEAAVASAKGQSAAQAYLSTYSSPGSSSPVSQPSQQQQLQRPQLLITTEKSPRLYDAEMGSAVPVSGHEIISVSALAERMSMPRPQTPRSPLTPHAAQPKHQSMYGNMFNVYQPTPLSPQHASTPAVHQMAIVHPGGNGQRSVRGVSSAIDLGGGRSNAGGSGVRTRRLSVNAAAAAGMNPAVDHTGVSRPLLASPASAVSPSPYYASYGQMPVSQQRPMSTAVPITTTRPTAERHLSYQPQPHHQQQQQQPQQQEEPLSSWAAIFANFGRTMAADVEGRISIDVPAPSNTNEQTAYNPIAPYASRPSSTLGASYHQHSSSTAGLVNGSSGSDVSTHAGTHTGTPGPRRLSGNPSRVSLLTPKRSSSLMQAPAVVERTTPSGSTSTHQPHTQ